jgi:hypothetical protein
MNSQSAHQGDIGETLPLFQSEESRGGHHRGRAVVDIAAPARQQTCVEQDRHMHVAWQLAYALKAGKAGRRPNGKPAKLSAKKKRQVGNAICEHLLASLREQVSAERSPADSERPSLAKSH